LNALLPQALFQQPDLRFALFKRKIGPLQLAMGSLQLAFQHRDARLWIQSRHRGDALF
jgi:hypothetical protein